tara:strand:+ start:1446 stop:1982 length:537 start_codon:yes stop_codon:yes gene_type:complete
MEFSFGIPSQRGKGTAATNFCTGTPALVVLKNAGPRTSKVMVLNAEACESLGIEDEGTIAFDFTKSSPVLVNTTGMELPKGQAYTVKSKKEYGGLTMRDSKLWAYFVKTYNLDETADSNFIFRDVISEDPKAIQISLEEKADRDQLSILDIPQEALYSANGDTQTDKSDGQSYISNNY